MHSRSRLVVLTSALALAVAMLAGPAAAEEHHDEIPEHPHALLIGLEFGPEGPTVRKCVDLAGGRALPLRAHHDNVHTGDGIDPETGMGINVRGIRTAGHAVGPFTCSDLGL